MRGCCVESGPRDDAIRVDGFAEAVWARAAIATGFVQFEPGDGTPASERTEARVLYGDKALYVPIRGISKISGGSWRVGTGVQTRMPGFEVAYAQPFVSAARYRGFKQVVDPVAEAYGDRHGTCSGEALVLDESLRRTAGNSRQH